MYSIAYLPKALDDIEESLKWYSLRSAMATANFVYELQSKVSEIKSDPFKFRNRYRNYYEATLKKFPFDIVYTVDENEILILSIYHQKRNPKKKYRRQ